MFHLLKIESYAKILWFSSGFQALCGISRSFDVDQFLNKYFAPNSRLIS